MSNPVTPTITKPPEPLKGFVSDTALDLVVAAADNDHSSNSGRVDYGAYMQSSGWRNNPTRLAELAASGHRCRICNCAENLEVHHRTYERLGAERQEDLTTLCSACHRTVTDDLRRRRYSSWSPDLRDTRRIADASYSLYDPTYGGRM